ncbi:MAG TPA: hypothetical protein VIT91_14110 [Chthoniobacterales bacterium]
MLLPNSEHAFIDIRKLADYSLDPTHPVGRHKSIVFRSALGITSDGAETLRDLLLRAVLVHEAAPGRLDEFGQRYTVDFPAFTAFGSAVLRSAWMVRTDEDFPRLITCFVLPD